MERGFISAPLLGTIIFLFAVVFIVHLVETEKSQVAIIVSETYHNNIVSTLENYRSDLGALFAVNVQRSIEKYLSSQCWRNFDMSNGAASTNPDIYGVPPRGFPGSGSYTSSFNYDDFQHSPGVSSQVFTSASSPLLYYEQGNNQLDYFELRYRACTRLGAIITEGICPTNSNYGVTSWIKSTKAELAPGDEGYIAPGDLGYFEHATYNYQGVKFTVPNRDLVDNFEYQPTCKFPLGANKFYVVKKDVFFRTSGGGCVGITPSEATTSGGVKQVCTCVSNPANPNYNCDIVDASGAALGPEANKDCQGVAGVVGQSDGGEMCRALIGEILFDCRNFAENLASPNRCCDRVSEYAPGNTNAGKCCTLGMTGNGCDGQDHVIPGCEDGTFYLNVNVLASDELFKSLPRVSAEDKAGNTVRSGALSDENFRVHIKYPFFKYYDAAFRAYGMVSYGVGNGEYDYTNPSVNMRVQQGGTLNNANGGEGVIEGWARVTNAADAGKVWLDEHENRRRIFRSPTVVGIGNEEHAARTAFYSTFFDPASSTSVCRLFNLRDADGNLVFNNMAMALGPPFTAGGQAENFCGTGTVPEAGAAPASHSPADLLSDEDAETNFAASMQTNLETIAGNPGDPLAPNFEHTLLNQLRYDVEFRDYDPARLVDSEAQPDGQRYNKFCWGINPIHSNPEYADGTTLVRPGFPEITPVPLSP